MPVVVRPLWKGTKMPQTMKVQINTDKQITMDIALARLVGDEVRRALGRFESQLTRVEVHLSDVNSHKPGLHDKRCQIEARPAGGRPVSVSIETATVEAAVVGAANKMKRLLETRFGRSLGGRPSGRRAA
jgi:Sigma 54 modulation protein / S30EA ribosomal protein